MPISLLDAIRLVEALTGRPAQVVHRPPQASDVLATWADIGKAQRLLGWRPAVSFEDGMARLVDWYRQQRAWAKDVSTATD